MTKISLNLEPRKLIGRKVKTLRRQGVIPVNIFGKKTKSVSAQINQQEFTKLFEKAGETNIVYVVFGSEKEERPCLISQLQTHPVTNTVLHVDFHQVDLSEKVTAEIPLELIGEAPAVSAENAAIVTQISEIEIEALPADLPDKFTLDISSLTKVGESLKISDLQYDKNKISIALDPETILVSAQAQQAEEVIEKPTEEAEETPVGESVTKDSDDKPEAETEKKEDGPKDSSVEQSQS